MVGGGPGGATTAALLAAAGRDVLLVDRARFPRPKPCGECIDPGAVAALERTGALPDVEALQPERLEGWRLRTRGADVAAAFGGGIHALALDRSRLDAALLSRAAAAGARILEGVQVLSVSAADGPPQREVPGPGNRPAVELRMPGGEVHTLRPRAVVGADGLRSVVVRSLELLARGPRLRKVSLSLHVDGEGLPRGQGVLDVGDDVTLGLAPVGPARWNVTVVTAHPARIAELGADPAAFAANVLRARFPTARWRAFDGPLASGPFDWPVRRAWAPGVALVGDAAGYFDPFTGQGIYRALRTAELAAPAVDEALRVGSWAPLRTYDARWQREVRWSRRVQRAVERVMSRPALRARVLRRLAASGGLSTVIRVTGDAAEPTTLLWPGVWLGGWSGGGG